MAYNRNRLLSIQNTTVLTILFLTIFSGMFMVNSIIEFPTEGEARATLNRGFMMSCCLERATPDKYIKWHLTKIRWCFEKEINKNPNMFGVIIVKFEINGSGRVNYTKIKFTSIRNTNIEKCVERQIKMIKFPKIRGGGTKIFEHQFLFKNSETY